MSHSKKWFVKDRKIVVRDKMQNYTYYLSYNAGTNLKTNINGIKHPHFKPQYTPQQMLKMGVFEGKYINDGKKEFPKEFYTNAKISKNPDSTLNYFGIKSRLSLQEWRKRGWVPIHKKDRDVRGWFQWYCRYWIGRRMPEVDVIQIKRWKSFKRHYAQVKKHAKNDLSKRRKQRQALLQWSWDCKV
jgi:hypothetical protein